MMPLPIGTGSEWLGQQSGLSLKGGQTLDKPLKVETLRLLLSYDPERGKLFWRERGRDLFATDMACRTWNARFSNKEAFCTETGAGYLTGTILYQQYMAHVVIWAMVTGKWPEEQIDHKDLCGTNNRWENLREATHCQNQYNKPAYSNNTSGYKGVSWDPQRKKWRASIRSDGKLHHIGRFSTSEAAHAAYCDASIKMHGEFSRPT